MAIIIEDGTLVTGANSYVTQAELSAYAAARGITIVGSTEQLLIKSMDYLESLQFVGVKRLYTQALQWPRAAVVIDGYYVSIDQIPAELKKSQIEIALSIDNGEDPQANIPRQKSSVKVGELAVTYEKGSATTIVRKISQSLYKLLAGGTGSSFKVDRG